LLGVCQQYRRDRQARDESAMQARLRHEAAEQEQESRDRLTLQRRLDETEARKLAKLTEVERKRALQDQQDEQRRRDRQARDESAMRAHLRHKAAAEARKAQEAEDRRLAKRALQDQQDEQRQKDRQARDESAMRAHLRHKAAEEERKAEASAIHKERLAEKEEQRLAKVKERERKRELDLQQEEQRRRDRQARDELGMRAHLRYEAAIDAQKAQEKLVREAVLCVNVEDRSNKRAIRIVQAQAPRTLQDDHRRRDREQRDEAGARALQRHKATVQAERVQQKALTEGRVVAFDGVLPSFLEEEYQYMKQASTDFPEKITSSIRMESMRAYERAISDASRRLPCGICRGLFQEDEMMSVGLRDDDLQLFLQRTKTAPDYCAVKDDMVNLCTTCNSAIAKRAIPPLSAGNFVNCLFCQDYPEALKNLNTVEEAFIARAHVIGIFLKLTSGAQKGCSEGD
jgi:hypothetical protein